eukprot:gene33554-19197_t
MLGDTDDCGACCANDTFIVQLCADADAAPASCAAALPGSAAVRGGRLTVRVGALPAGA